MKTALFTSLIAITASQVSAQFNVTSKPFSLVVKSSNKTLDNSALFACHEGAAIEGLCLGSKYNQSAVSPSSTFSFNTSYYEENPTNQTGKQGLLVWLLSGSNFQVSSPMALSYDPISNVAVPLFSPADSGTLVQFDKANKLNIRGYRDDTVSPINTNAPKDYYRWYICNTYVGYSYTTLAWVVGNQKPQNPSCQKVDIVRKFN